MEQFLYVSTAACGITARQIGDILDVSRRNNARLEISGVLLFAGGSFIQLLEGPREGLDAIISRLAVDPRHHAMLTILRGPIRARALPDWTMGWLDLGAAPLRPDLPMPGVQERIEAMAPGEAQVMLMSFLHSAVRVPGGAGGAVPQGLSR